MRDIEVTEVRVKLASEDDDKLLGYCSVTLNNAFVIKDLKIIQGDESPFIAMPSRKITDKCPKCGYKNHLRAKFCNECGSKLPGNRADTDARGRAKRRGRDCRCPWESPARAGAAAPSRLR